MSYTSIFALMSEEQRKQLGLVPLQMPAAAAAAALPAEEELPEWARARTPRPEEEEEEEPIAGATEDDTYDVCHTCGIMYLPADNHHHEQGEGESEEED
jgi:hypothetical protein